MGSQDYRNAAKWTTLANWTADEKVSHFLEALDILPDNRHALPHASYP